MNLINKKNFTFSYTHSHDDAFLEIPYEAAHDGLALEIPIVYLIRNNLSVSTFSDYLYLESSAGHISTKGVWSNGSNLSCYYDNDRYSRYFYYDIDFGDKKITESDLNKIENKMKALVKQNAVFERNEVS